MKKMTMVLLSLFLSTASALAGQVHLAADSSGREYYSMSQENRFEKTVSHQNLANGAIADGLIKEVVATCSEVIDGNIGDIAKTTVTMVADIQVVSYTSNGPYFNSTIENAGAGALVDFNLDCSKRPAGLRSTSDCRTDDQVIMIRHKQVALLSETITKANYNIYSKQLRLTKTRSVVGMANSVLIDVVLQCK